MASEAAVFVEEEEEVVVFLREALPWSRIFWIWAERLGLVVVGGGGVWWVSEGREMRARWRLLRAVRAEGREASERVWGWVAVMALDWGSIVRGRRVKVSSRGMSIVGD